MRKSRAHIFVAAFAMLGALALASYEAYVFAVPIIDFRYLDPTLPSEERIEILLSQMTLEEKIGQMALVEKNSVHDLKDISRYGLGGLLTGGTGRPEKNTAAGWLAMVTEYEDMSRRSRLGIPLLFGVDAIHGNASVPGATVFPHFIGLGASRDADLVRKIGEATAAEMKAVGIFWTFSPNLDMPTDIRWGRVYEAFSSDPKLVSTLGVAYLTGLQDTVTGTPSVLGTAKHYLGAGATAWGTSRYSNYKIDQGVTAADETMLREVYLAPFTEAVHAGVLSIMTGLNSFGDTKIAANKFLLTEVLKNDLGFTGFVVSDWYGVYALARSKYEATVMAINAGIDMVMLPYEYVSFAHDTREAVRMGDIPLERIDDAVRRILRAKFAVGLFEKKEDTTLADIGSEPHRALARDAVSRSLVLLKNTNNTVPFSAAVRRIVVAGSSADNIARQTGAWTSGWQATTDSIPGATSIVNGLREVAPKETDIVYGVEAGVAEGTVLADVGIAIVGEKPYAEGVGDTANPALSAEDLATIASLQTISKKIVVIIVSGRPLLLPPEWKTWDALIASWLPGSEGAGVADVLFGKEPFVGKLPLPWPANADQLPFSPEGKSADRTAPLFPFGFGLR